MSAHPPQTRPLRRYSTVDIRARKGTTPVVALAAYTAPVARILDPYVDLLLVGDSLGMTVYGMESTLAVSLEMMIAHGAAVVRASERACVVVDLPFGSYQASPAQAFAAAARVLAETGCAGVKLEGGREMAETIRFLVERGIPVMAHVGLLPQHVHRLGGYRPRGKSAEERALLLEDAKAAEEAGAFAVVIENTREDAAREITSAIAIPTIGIGASPACDGQVLVIDDLLGMSAYSPRFALRHSDFATLIARAAMDYRDAVTTRAFPAAEHCTPAKE